MSIARLRFAPSPTGFLHIGGARTAIFNYLLAKKLGGKFLLRIEDTDRQRSKPEYEKEILDAMAWLGLESDEPPLRQSTRLSFHREAVEEMIERGAAFRCFVTPDEAAKIKEQLQAEGGRQAFRSPDRDLSREESLKRAQAGEPFAVRFKVTGDSVRYTDGVHGVVETPTTSIDDFIIMRTDGTPTYMVAVVADDYEMGVTHVIRGDDHVNNTPKQILIYRALGWEPPEFAHVPLILGSDKKRLSKRHGATAITEYKETGYLPEAVLSYLAMLGWSPGDERENLTLEELVEAFDVKGINKRSAVFDERKLEWANGQFISMADDTRLEMMLRPLVAEKVINGEFEKGAGKALPTAVRLLKSRCHFPQDIIEKGFYYFREPDTIIDHKAAKKRLKDPETPDYLEKLADVFEALELFDEETVEATMRRTAEDAELGIGKYIHPTRLAVSGQGAGPGLFEILVALGKETTVRRMRWLAGFLREKGCPPQLDEE